MGADGTFRASLINRSISLFLSSRIGHFRIPMPSMGRPVPIPFILRSDTDWRVMKLFHLVDIDAEAPVSTQICSMVESKL
jgi:hypothetical protein